MTDYGTVPAPAETTKKTPTKRDVTAAIAALAPEKAAEISAGDKERTKRKGQLEAQVQRLATDLQNLGVDDGTPADAVAVFKALGVIVKKGSAAIDSLTDVKLGVAEKPAPKPRAQKETTGAAVLAPDAEPEAEAEPVPENESADDQAAREQRQAERLDAAAGTGGRPGVSQAPARGDSDPNAGDGF